MKDEDKRIDSIIKQNEWINDKMRILSNQITDLKRKNTMLKNELEAIVLGINRTRSALDEKIACNGRGIGKLHLKITDKEDKSASNSPTESIIINIDNATLNL